MRALFEQEYPKHEKSLFLVAMAYLHNSEDAKDCVQEAAFQAYRSIEKLRHREYFKTWITRILINKCKDYLRAKRFTDELSDNLEVFSYIPTEHIEIFDAVCRMDKRISVYLTLRFYNNMNYTEVAGALRQPVSTVKYRTKKALEELKNILEGDF